MKVEIRQPESEPLASLAALDVERLSRGNHKIEIGFIKGGCCRNLVRAVVKNGMVTGFEVEPCKDLSKTAGEGPQEDSGGREVATHSRCGLVRSSARRLELIIVVGGGCIFICVWGYCVMCCWWPRPHCLSRTSS
jgi:hypothetical protein